MHDIDRTTLEYNGKIPEFGQAEWSGESFGESYGETWNEIFGEGEQEELAAELLSVNNEAELDQFLGSLLSRAARAVGDFAQTPAGRALGGALKGVAKKALPLAGGALGGWIGGPLGAKIGSGLANAAGQALGLEYQGASQEEQEFAGARRFINLAANAIKSAATAANPNVDPRITALNAATAAARVLAPGLLGPGAPTGTTAPVPTAPGAPVHNRGSFGQGRSGRWVRRGNQIILFGA